jgi:uncharacterized protein with ParB-like and HNH nuclease domain
MAKLFSISEIFDRRILRVPDFQRGYSWGERQLGDFWDDLEKVASDKIHYTGLLTIEKVQILANNIKKWNDTLFLVEKAEGENYTPFYIVDGQQRITTAIILISSILDKLQLEETISGFSKNDIVQRYIKIENQNGKTFLFGYEKDDPSYEYLKARIFNENAANLLNEPETLYTKYLEKGKTFFDEKVRDISKPKLENLFIKLTQNIKFNLYEVDEDLDVYVMFETMNNRGKPLSKLELLKNRLIYLSTILVNSEEEKSQLREQINNSWKTIYSFLGKNRDQALNDDDFLKNHTYMYFRNNFFAVEANSYSVYLLDEYFITKKITDKVVRLADIENYVISIQKSVQKWFEIKFPFHSSSTLDNKLKEWVDKINRLDYPPFLPNIMAALLSNPPIEDMLKLLKAMDRYAFLVFKIYQSRAHMGKNLFYGQAHILYDTKDIWELKRLVEQRTGTDTKDYDIKMFQSELIEILQNVRDKRGYFAWNGIYYFLYEYELFLQGKEEQKVTYEKFYKRNSVEHIYPQNPKDDCWLKPFEKYSNDHRIKLKNSLGNLLLLSIPKNSQLQNKCFEFKQRHQAIGSADEYKGYFNGSHSEIAVNAYTQWTAKEILERGLKMLKFLEDRWDVKFGNFDQKKKLLFLDFLKIEEHELTINN